MAGIPTSNILQPGVIAVSGGVDRALISNLQLFMKYFFNNLIYFLKSSRTILTDARQK